MDDRDGVGVAESPFLLEALQRKPEPDELLRRLAAVARQLQPAARRHVERALVRHLIESGVRERAALQGALRSLRQAFGAGEAEEEEEEESDALDQELPTDALGVAPEEETEETSYEAALGSDEEAQDGQDESDYGWQPLAAAEYEDDEAEPQPFRERGDDEASPEQMETPFLDSEEAGRFDAQESECPCRAHARGMQLELEAQSLPLPRLRDELAGLSASEVKAIRITSTFETGRAGGFGGLTGNFDGQGLSFGLLNWTIKAGSLIPLLQDFITRHAERYAQIFGRDKDRFKAMVFATKLDPSTGRKQRDVATQMQFVTAQMNDAVQRNIIEPWASYFKGLENDPAFRNIEVDACRRALKQAKTWCDRFGWKSERGFVFMFDLVSSHGAAWLNAPRLHGQRKRQLEQRLDRLKQALQRAPSELETMEAIANMIADTSAPRWRKAVRIRKLWFVHGAGKVHGKRYSLRRDFNVSDEPPQLSAAAER